MPADPLWLRVLGHLFGVLFGSMAPFLDRPWLALLPAAAFAAGYLRVRRRRGARALPLAGAAVTWAAYAAWEAWATHLDRAAIGAPIRVDVVLVAPLLYLATGLGLWRAWTLGRAPHTQPRAR